MEAEERKREEILEAKLGFDRIRKMISDRCSTEYATARVQNEEFSCCPKEIRRRLLLTDEMRLIVMFEDSFPSVGYVDCTSFLKILENDGTNIDLLSMGKLRTMLETLQKLSVFFSAMKDGVYPNLKRMMSPVILFPDVQKKIDSIIDKYGNVKDTASDTLYSIRKSLKDKEGAISKRINSVLRKAREDGIVDEDANAVVRDGKMLIPVSSANKRKIAGFVYDESSTGKTTFIQPIEIVEIENELNELHFAESREIVKILADFSDFLRPSVPILHKNAEIIGETDFIIAKAQVALDLVAGMPVISDSGEMNLRKARHPLLEKSLKREGKEIVPLTVALNPQKHILLISGPNAGGKSVCLKTVGLLQYMFQWGMLIPTSESSEMPVFDRIMVDIGDGQSIDNDLSTYSSFLIGMKSMLMHADSKTLVLIDEFGAGTEPAAGGAIAEAILSVFDKNGVYGVITTHYTNLKLYASGEETGVVNGAMAFDVKNIVPLFKLDIGLPGNSFAFELARKTGLPEAIVKDAERRAGEEFVGIEKNLRQIARNRKALDEKLQRIRTTDKTLESITGKYQQELEGIKKIREEIIGTARKEAEEIVKNANRQVEQTIKTIQESKAEKKVTVKARQDLKDFVSALAQRKEMEEQNREDYLEEKLRKLEERQQRQKQRREQRASDAEKQRLLEEEAERKRIDEFRNGPLKVGEKVRITDNGMVGEVLIANNKTVTISVGNITSKMPRSKVERITSNEFKDALKESRKSESTPRNTVSASITEDRLNFKPEIDVRGARVDEAIEQVMKFVDTAMMLNMSSVRIIHGKGTGALREEIQKFLRATAGISSVKDESVQFGGSGVTIVTFE